MFCVILKELYAVGHSLYRIVRMTGDIYVLFFGRCIYICSARVYWLQFNVEYVSFVIAKKKLAFYLACSFNDRGKIKWLCNDFFLYHVVLTVFHRIKYI
jgi:hypothetical protein